MKMKVNPFTGVIKDAGDELHLRITEYRNKHPLYFVLIIIFSIILCIAGAISMIQDIMSGNFPHKQVDYPEYTINELPSQLQQLHFPLSGWLLIGLFLWLTKW